MPNTMPVQKRLCCREKISRMRGARAYVHVGVRGPVVVLVVPEALGGDANALPAELADDGLHDDLVARDREV